MATKPIAQRITEWQDLQEKVKAAVKTEMALRKEIFAELFPSPKEGVNTKVLQDGRTIKATHKITREVDEPALTSAWSALVEAKLPVDALIKTKPSLVLSAFRTLTDEQHMIFDACLTIKPGAPSIEIEAAPKAKL